MLVVRDFKCKECGVIQEKIIDSSRKRAICECGNMADKIFSINTTAPVDVSWIGSVREVVDPHGGEHCTEFLKHPSRANYNTWKDTEGLRHLEPGEAAPQPESKESRQSRVKPQLIKKLRDREALSI